MTYRELHIAQRRAAELMRERERAYVFVSSPNNTPESLERYEYELRRIERELDTDISSEGTIAR